jgi:hypothetical protein
LKIHVTFIPAFSLPNLIKSLTRPHFTPLDKKHALKYCGHGVWKKIHIKVTTYPKRVIKDLLVALLPAQKLYNLNLAFFFAANLTHS